MALPAIQDWWGLGSALKNENHDFDLATIMDVGATTVRFAHYQQSDYLYSRCDMPGIDHLGGNTFCKPCQRGGKRRIAVTSCAK